MKKTLVVIVAAFLLLIIPADVSHAQAALEQYDLLDNSLFVGGSLDHWIVNGSYSMASVNDRCEPNFLSCNNSGYEFRGSNEGTSLEQSFYVPSGSYNWSVTMGSRARIFITDCVDTTTYPNGYAYHLQGQFAGSCTYTETTYVTVRFKGAFLFDTKVLDPDFIPFDPENFDYGWQNESLLDGQETYSCIGAILSGDGSDPSANPVNLLSNPSFEDGSVVPDGWSYSSGLYAPSTWRDIDPLTGSMHIFASAAPQLDIKQNLSGLPDSDGWVFGVKMKNTETFGISGVTSIYLGLNIASTDPLKPYDSYNSLEGQAATAGSVFNIRTPDTNLGGAVYIDDAYLVPVELDPVSGEITVIDCDAVNEYWGGDGGDDGGDSGNGGIVAPSGISGTITCYLCEEPTSSIDITAWWKWLVCNLSNYFCELIYSLIELSNPFLSVANWFSSLPWTMAQSFVNLSAWIGQYIPDFLSWLLSLAIEIAANVTPITNVAFNQITETLSVFNDFDFESFQNLLSLFFSSFFDVIRLIYDYIVVINFSIDRTMIAFDADPITIEEFLGYNPYATTAGDGPPVEGDVLEGFSDGTLFLTLVWGLYLSDGWVLDFELWPIVWISHGVMAIMTVLWFAREMSRTVTVTV